MTTVFFQIGSLCPEHSIPCLEFFQTFCLLLILATLRCWCYLTSWRPWTASTMQHYLGDWIHHTVMAGQLLAGLLCIWVAHAVHLRISSQFTAISILSGVSQGSVLGPILFLLPIYCSWSTVIMFIHIHTQIITDIWDFCSPSEPVHSKTATAESCEDWSPLLYVGAAVLPDPDWSSLHWWHGCDPGLCRLWPQGLY